MPKHWVTMKDGSKREVDCWQDDALLRKVAVAEAFSGEAGITAADKQRVHEVVYEYSARRLAGTIRRVQLAEFAAGLGFTVEQIKPIIRTFVRKGSEADRILFDVSVWG